jgi:hypothetical protein
MFYTPTRTYFRTGHPWLGRLFIPPILNRKKTVQYNTIYMLEEDIIDINSNSNIIQHTPTTMIE